MKLLKIKIVLPVKSVTMKRTRTVIVDSTPNLEPEHVPVVVHPIVERILSQHENFRNQMDARIQLRKGKYNKLLVGAF